MSFVRIKCSTCDGAGGFKTYMGHGNIHEEICTVCNGEGNIVIHTGVIGSSGSYQVAVDPAGGPDECWATVWRRHEDGQLELIESGKVSSDVQDAPPTLSPG